MAEELHLQRFLDAVTEAIRARDFDAVRGRVALPLAVTSFEGPAVVATEAALRRHFEVYCDNLDRLGIDGARRVVTSFCEIGPGLAACGYEATLLRGARAALPPFASTVTLRLLDGRWRVVSLMSEAPAARAWFRDPCPEAAPARPGASHPHPDDDAPCPGAAEAPGEARPARPC